MQSSILLTLVLSSLIFTASAEDDVSSKAIDTNQDMKVDRIESFRNGDLISVARDTKYNGHFNETSYYFPYESPVKPTEIIEKDTDGDGKVDRVEKIYRNPKLDLMITTVKVTRKAGQRDPASTEKQWTTYSRLSQLKVDDGAQCLADLNIEALPIMGLVGSIDSIRYALEDGFYKTGWGYNIHQSCMDKWGADKFPELLKDSMQTGLKCLEDLAKTSSDPKTPNGAYRNVKELAHLLSTKPIAVTCDEKRNWDFGQISMASVNAADRMNNSKVKHPFISINPAFPQTPGKGTTFELDEMKKTLFHEQFHNIGLRHTQGQIEYAYSCETCCMPDKDTNKKEKDLACRVCSGNYSGITDKKYIKDIIALGDYASFAIASGQEAALSYQNEGSKDRFGIAAFALAASGPLDPVGVELGKLLKAKLANLTKEESSMIEESQKTKLDKKAKLAEPVAKLVAEAHYNLYMEENKEKVLAGYEKEIMKLAKLMDQERHSKDMAEQTVYKGVREKIEYHLSLIALDNYPENDGPLNKRAKSLMKDLGLHLSQSF